ncbi:hypothetical protein N0B16_00460 [Chryseobacterium sp. GMJ5]|uniref:Uncharacterized protein n=1 Tax=Chryseobacterium gilvum TaxID=2976534 RepID=A0ABT2VSC0_9FLAO|nr:hypothetical protein [Chryseobacterium gilvum]MCU7612903.1 hypothetical protein [Chryseobacterium gilvum]
MIAPITDFFTNIKDKLTSTFFGTFIFVWILRNWDFVYTFFNFEKNSDLHERITYIRCYFYSKNIYCETPINIVFTIVLIILGYTLVTLTKTISALFDKLMLWITSRIFRKRIISKEEFNEMEAKFNDYSKKYEEQREIVREYSKTRDDQKELIFSKDSEIKDLESEKSKFTTTINEKSEEIHRLQLRYDSAENEMNNLKTEMNLLNGTISRLRIENDTLNNTYKREKSESMAANYNLVTELEILGKELSRNIIKERYFKPQYIILLIEGQKILEYIDENGDIDYFNLTKGVPTDNLLIERATATGQATVITKQEEINQGLEFYMRSRK